MKKYIVSLLALVLGAAVQVSAQPLEKVAEQRIKSLNKLINKADKKDINTLKERTAVRTAEIFLGYAMWDEKNVEANEKHFLQAHRYKNEAAKYAEELPDWERQDIVTMLDDAIVELTSVIDGEIVRLDTPDVDWAKVSVDGDELKFDDQAVFLADWTWKPSIAKYERYHGAQDGYFLTPMYVTNNQGDVTPRVIEELTNKPDGRFGFVFLNHSDAPAWAKKQDPTLMDGAGIKYTAYDINNPLSRQIISDLYSATIPLMAGKKYTELGYMLCNEPHWNSVKGEWAAGPISDRAYAEFIVWLKDKHKTIERLNELWATSYKSFDEIDTPRIMDAKSQGTPYYFDFMRFNMARVNEWFAFLDSEVKKYDPAAKTHIKIMPNLWSEGKRDHGVDMEAITRNTDIIGNDASTCGAFMWGKPQEWEARYSYNWREICMAYDFFKSVSPNKIMFNSEGHMLSTNRYRDLNQTPAYVRNNYWLATIHGLSAIQTWYWARREDGSSRDHFDSNGYAASNNHQPRVVNEVHATVLDLNSVSDYIMDFQRQRKPLRIFYTEASAINSQEYIEDIYKVYERCFFDGTPLGFATAGIIDNNDNEGWDVIVLSKSPKLFEKDVVALQNYVDRGGVVVVDGQSMLTNEYGEPLKATLKSTKGEVLRVESTEELVAAAYDQIELPKLKIVETNKLNQKLCTWRVIPAEDGGLILNLVNLGKVATTLDIQYRDGAKTIGSMTNVLTGEKVENNLELAVDQVLLLKIK